MIFLDTETTGLIKNPLLPLVRQPYIIEIGAINSEGEEFSSLIRPPVLIEEVITKITGITNDALKDAPTFAEIFDEFVSFCLGEDTMVAHNMPFDHGMLVFEMRRLGMEYQFPWPRNQIDTIDLAKPLYRGKFKKLSDLGRDLCNIEDEQKHRAIDDVKLLIAVYEELTNGNRSQN